MGLGGGRWWEGSWEQLLGVCVSELGQGKEGGKWGCKVGSDTWGGVG